MKKLIMTMAVCVGLGGTALAQKIVDNYDTLHGNYYPYYYYNFCWDDFSTPFSPCYGPTPFWFLPIRISQDNETLLYSYYWCSIIQPAVEEVAVYMQPDSATHVVGIAFCDRCEHRTKNGDSTNTTSVWFLTDTGVLHITLYDTNMNVLYSALVNHDTLPTARYLHMKAHDPNPPFVFWENIYIPIHEYYFNTGIDLAGNFYIGVRQDTFSIGLNTLFEYRCWRDSMLVTPLERCRYRLSVQQEGGWLDEECNYGVSTLLWPILERPGDSCPDVQGLRWSRLGSGTTAFVQWEAGVNHRDWQLCYGPAGTPAGEGTVVDCPPAQCVLPGLAAGQQYDVYVRARCRFARDEWTGWSGPLEVGFGSPGEGIEGAAGLHAELTPNPATGRVRVSCGEALRRVEVYDLQGRRCLAQEVQGTETVLDISALAAGRYTVLLHTATTTAAKAQVVQ